MVKLVGSALLSFKKVQEAFWAKSEEMNCLTSKGEISMRADVVVWERDLCLTPSCVHPVFLFADLAEVQAWHSCESGLAVWDILVETWPTCESKHLSNKCSAWVSLCLIKCVAMKSKSLGSWLNLPIVSYLPRETQAALKQGHIFAGYFGLICKSIDAKRTRECLISRPTLSSEDRLSGFEGFNCHVYGDNAPHLQEKKKKT